MKKLLKIFICAALVLVLFAGCQSSAGTGDVKTDEEAPVTAPAGVDEPELQLPVIEGTVTADGITLRYEASNGKAVVYYPEDVPSSHSARVRLSLPRHSSQLRSPELWNLHSHLRFPPQLQRRLSMFWH